MITEISKFLQTVRGETILNLNIGDPFTDLVLSLRNGTYDSISSNLKVWKEYVELCMKPTVPKDTWKRLHVDKVVSDIFTPFDEAMGRITFENNIKVWISECVDKPDRREVRRVYTGHKATGTNNPVKGWSEVGKKRFNEIVREVVLERKKDERKQIELELSRDYRKIFYDLHEENESNEEDATTEEEFVPLHGFGPIPI